eukprot:Rhum_TRINITY_DN23138_c0_g1::Rhum_TRINITY_DN23138_c0_g1_i1::g.177141::m.177141
MSSKNIADIFLRPHLPALYKGASQKGKKYTTGTMFNHYYETMPGKTPWTPSINTMGLSEKHQPGFNGFQVIPRNSFRFPSFLRERAGGKWGWNRPATQAGLTPLKQIMEQTFESGHLEGDAGEMWPEQIMQTWFGKRIQHRRGVTWSEEITPYRIFPNIRGWNDEAAPISVYSELLDYQFRPAIDVEALLLMESYGGIDQWVLQNDPSFLTSFEMEVVRNYLLVRKMEMKKNFVMDRQAEKLAQFLLEKIRDKHIRDKKAKLEASASEPSSGSLPEGTAAQEAPTAHA